MGSSHPDHSIQSIMQIFVVFSIFAAAAAQPSSYVHVEVPAEPYVHQEIAAEPYQHVEIAAEPYVHIEPNDAYAAGPIWSGLCSTTLDRVLLADRTEQKIEIYA